MKQTLEEAAKEYASCEVIDGGLNGLYGIDASKYEPFIAGAEWQAKQSPWISVEEVLPPVGLDVIHTDINTVKRYYGQVNKVGTLVLGWTPHGEVTATHYMLIPQLTFDEILEANKDVLERIKEKED